ncbi:nucleoside/nucleotide kinase family protein [Williamsia sp. CHRR-6]|uniref:nucleoside/nucleotide kinase family protein n=1 Tax=Williamsia sp. CHRR-6 TaxID=2835871 RepID=UPI001BD9E8B3|nr:nucleoside/nucleotide kinase family protein [Williamsia sp. CHRR-6]MBT0567128.1 nucleoside/nucleotide kinase family protein [Williamsia sp. CHRR-6]
MVSADLVAAARELARVGARNLLGVTGPPGVGKSTLCAGLCGALGDDAVVVGMDGFHLAGAELQRLGLADRKGAPETFDVGGYVALLDRLRSQTDDVVYAPVFDRSLEESIGSAVRVSASMPLVITEGNYLLLESGGWYRVRARLDEVWYLDLDDDVRRDRLIRRHEMFGRSPDAARAWVAEVDERNAAVIAATRERADRIVMLNA